VSRRFWPTPSATALRILFDKNVPVGVRRFVPDHEVHTVVEMQWHPQLENGELLKAAEAAGFDVIVTSDQNIRYQQNLEGRKLALVVLGSNIWPVVRDYEEAIISKIDAATPGSYGFIEMVLPPKPRRPRG
jgi:predicted nuclease of predicted toxin-antitoxin system